jgi:peptide/nickel transport system substrate-binding protein
VRRALSLGIDRAAISEFMYFGIADPANNSLLPRSPLWTDAIGLAYTDHDVERANALLDEAGLAERNAAGIRLLPDGRPMEIIVETAGEDIEHADALELVAGQWREIGVKLLTKPSQREVLRTRIFAGDTLMTIAKGIENGLPTAEMSPAPYAPTRQIDYQWPKWGQYYETKGSAGEPVDMAGPERLFALFEDWQHAAETAERRDIWKEMLRIWSDGVYTLGLVSGVRQPVAVHPDLVNVPEEAVYNWDPGAHFGIYYPDTFWWRDGG